MYPNSQSKQQRWNSNSSLSDTTRMCITTGCRFHQRQNDKTNGCEGGSEGKSFQLQKKVDELCFDYTDEK